MKTPVPIEDAVARATGPHVESPDSGVDWTARVKPPSRSEWAWIAFTSVVGVLFLVMLGYYLVTERLR